MNAVHQSRWGFHPCSYETHRKLKYLAKWYFRTLRDVASWRRWYNKAPQNRVIRHTRDADGRRVLLPTPVPRPEPTFCPLFAERRTVSSYAGQVEVAEFHPRPSHVWDDYRNARRPAATPEEVTPLTLSEGYIDKLYEEVRAWEQAGRAAA